MHLKPLVTMVKKLIGFDIYLTEDIEIPKYFLILVWLVILLIDWHLITIHNEFLLAISMDR